MARSRVGGNAFATDMGNKKEALDNAIADLADSFPGSCWDMLPASARRTLSGWACSADQASDYNDNATGRDCGSNCKKKSCAECCKDNRIDSETKDGPGTSRPYGPRCSDRYKNEL